MHRERVPAREVPEWALFREACFFCNEPGLWIAGVRRRTNSRAAFEYSGFVDARQSRNLRLQGALYENPVKLSQ